MSLFGILIVLLIIGVLLYLVHAVIPWDPKIRIIFDVVVIVAVCLWLLQSFGILPEGQWRVRLR
jgi:hypothetical protein